MMMLCFRSQIPLTINKRRAHRPQQRNKRTRTLSNNRMNSHRTGISKKASSLSRNNKKILSISKYYWSMDAR